jgi:ribonuclease III
MVGGVDVAVRNSLVAPVHDDQLTTAPASAVSPRADEVLGHQFTRPELLREALTHRSALSGKPMSRGRTAPSTGAGSNERLEFIGDRVLGLVIAEWLAERFPDEQEGALGPRLAHLVSQPTIAAIADQLGLPALLAVAPGESRAGVRKLATVLADATEALIGALYLDGGLEPARAFVRRAWDETMRTQATPPKDAKTMLQEWLLGRGMKLPDYELVSRNGPPHDPVFVIAVAGAGERGQGAAGSKRVAERLAAEDLLRKLGVGNTP